jgi:hypothetical protein
VLLDIGSDGEVGVHKHPSSALANMHASGLFQALAHASVVLTKVAQVVISEHRSVAIPAPSVEHFRMKRFGRLTQACPWLSQRPGGLCLR